MPPAFQEWGDCIVTVAAVSRGGKVATLATERLNAARPVVPEMSRIGPDFANPSAEAW